jgi:hypothetical protein
MKRLSEYSFILFLACLFLCCCKEKDEPLEQDSFSPDYVVVTQHGIKNDGSEIGKELNELVRANYGRTLYFPPGVYRLSEPIVLPFDYSKNVNLILDHNAEVTSSKQLEALLKIGFSEMKNTSRMRLFSFVEGGTFNAENADIGIWVNGLKQLVSLRTLNVIKCHGTHIKISVTNDFQGTGSSDTKLDNVTIQGLSSNEKNYGIYIDRSCCDCKISDCFIYGTGCALYTASAGHVINNVHILSWVASGGKDNGQDNFKGTEGMRIESGGFFTFNEIYFDTTDRDLVIGNVSPSIILDKPMSYSWFKGLGSAFVYRPSDYQSKFQLKVSGGNIDLGNKASNFKVFDIARNLIPLDTDQNIAFYGNNLMNASNLYPLDHSLMMKIRGVRNDLVTDSTLPFGPEWNSLGALAPGLSWNHLEIRLTDQTRIRLRIRFSPEGRVDIEKETPVPDGFTFGYTVVDQCCLLLLKPSSKISLMPEIIDLDGNSSYLCTPCKDRVYVLKDYTSSTYVTSI